ncbi:MAG: AraC family transcriptional regulator [Cyclobacteriaceae bacterium]|nr:AraC family transcriptional regulator [Cyclobacteriaceae bacterium]
MRALYENIASKKGNESFVAYALKVAFFEFKWHYHPEYELTLITKGKGKRLVGDSYENYETGDLVLLGADLPHTWSSDPVKNKPVSAIVIQFSPDFAHRFLELDEFKKIASLLASSARGLFFPDSKSIRHELELLPTQTGVEKITSLLAILQKLTTLKHYKLSSEYFEAIKGEETESRINKVCRHIQTHAAENLSLEQVAALIHLSRSAFSKFFKRATGKTFSDYVNDIRIGNACHLLTETDKAINEIAYQTGFESLTYFNRVFLKKKNITPRDFRNRIL